MRIVTILNGIVVALLIAFISSVIGIDSTSPTKLPYLNNDKEFLPNLQIDGPDPDTGFENESTQLPPSLTLHEDELIGESNGFESNANEDNKKPIKFLERIKRQIPFITKWLSGLGDDDSSRSKKSNRISAAESKNINNHKGYVTAGSIVAKPGPPFVNSTDRDGRFLSLFTVIRFDNSECLSVSGDNGTCYPSAECYRRGGSPNGKCAQGYGVCCVFSKSCGASTNQNVTYFTHNGYSSTSAGGSFDGTGSCQLTIYKAAPDICQYRLDFDSFNVAQPSLNGVCNNDQFIVSGSTTAVPIICGINSGNHMYIDVGTDNSPVTLSVVTSGPTYSRSWKIKITQIRCHSITRAPEGCLQYHQGVSGIIRSYNFDFASGQQLSNQDYTACIRMERNFCGIRYTACTDTESLGTQQTQQRSRAFSLTGQATQAGQSLGAQVSSQSCQTDWITIPCATNSGRVQQLGGTVCQDRICGDVFNSEVSQLQMPVFSYSKPFRVTLHTDANEANDNGNRGFCLNYIQQPCTPLQ